MKLSEVLKGRICEFVGREMTDGEVEQLAIMTYAYGIEYYSETGVLMPETDKSLDYLSEVIRNAESV